MGISENYQSIIKELESYSLPKTPTLIAVSKFQPQAKVKEALSAGILHFGENRVQEGLEKFRELGVPGKDFILHHIGPLQSSHIRKYAGMFSFVHGLGSKKLLEELRNRMEKDRWPLGFFLQANLTDEETKSGFSRKELLEILKNASEYSGEYCKLEGLMTMGPSSGDLQETKKVFHELSEIRKEFLPDGKCSMGMSGDYRIAIEEGADYLRIGTAIFGDRT